jgi:hypothetical protein
MRQSNLTKFNEIKSQLDAKGAAFAHAHFGGNPPQAYYKIDVNYTTHPGVGYHIAEMPVTSIRYAWRLPYFSKRPSDADVEKARALLGEEMKPEGLYLHSTVGATSLSVPVAALDAFSNGQQCSRSREKLEPILADLIAVYVLKDGQFACRYCRKATDEKSKHVGVIIARQYPGGRKSFDYCSAKCNSHDQMGHEG